MFEGALLVRGSSLFTKQKKVDILLEFARVALVLLRPQQRGGGSFS